MGLSVSALRLGTLETLEVRSTRIIVAVECLKSGQKPCTSDRTGNTGSGNEGQNNFGTNNVGDNNIGAHRGWPAVESAVYNMLCMDRPKE